MRAINVGIYNMICALTAMYRADRGSFQHQSFITLNLEDDDLPNHPMRVSHLLRYNVQIILWGASLQSCGCCYSLLPRSARRSLCLTCVSCGPSNLWPAWPGEALVTILTEHIERSVFAHKKCLASQSKCKRRHNTPMHPP